MTNELAIIRMKEITEFLILKNSPFQKSQERLLLS